MNPIISTFIIVLMLVFLIGCNNQAPPVQNANTAAVPPRKERSETVIAHTTENQQAPMPNSNASATGTKTKWSQSGNPIDTARFDGTIAQAEKNLKAKPSDESAKKLLAQAYFDRGFALTEARQYAAALGDYRKALKLDPANEEAKKWIDQIIMIYDSMGKEYPKEGEEPPPLPFESENGKK